MATESTAPAPQTGRLIGRELTDRILREFYSVYNELGYGFFESVYSAAMTLALRERALRVEEQVAIEVVFRGRPVGLFRADLIIESRIVIELKAGRRLCFEHERQLLNYLRATNLEVGLLLNFGPRPTFRRVVLSKQFR